jgi:hypothetical protein
LAFPEIRSNQYRRTSDLSPSLNTKVSPEENVPLLFTAEHTLVKLVYSIELWSDIVQDMIFAGRKGVDGILCAESEQCFSSDEWMGIMKSDGVCFEDGERVEWAMAAIL